MSDILTYILASRIICRPSEVPGARAEQLFYETAAPYAGTMRALRRRIARWTRRREHKAPCEACC